MTHSGGLGAAPISKLGLFHPRGLRVPTSARSSGWSSSPVFSQEEEASPGFADPPLPRALAGPPAARPPQACGCHGFQAARRGPRGPAQGTGLGKAARELTACTQPPGRRGQLHTGNVLPRLHLSGAPHSLWIRSSSRSSTQAGSGCSATSAGTRGAVCQCLNRTQGKGPPCPAHPAVLAHAHTHIHTRAPHKHPETRFPSTALSVLEAWGSHTRGRGGLSRQLPSKAAPACRSPSFFSPDPRGGAGQTGILSHPRPCLLSAQPCGLPALPPGTASTPCSSPRAPAQPGPRTLGSLVPPARGPLPAWEDWSWPLAGPSDKPSWLTARPLSGQPWGLAGPSHRGLLGGWQEM